MSWLFQNSTFGYAGGGQSIDNTQSQVPYTDFYRYDPILNTWSRMADAPNVEKSYPGGSSSPSSNIHVANLSTSGITEYNSDDNLWNETYNGVAATNREPQTFSIMGKVYFVGGINNTLTNGTNNQVWEYDPETNNMTRKNDFPGVSRYGGFSFSIGNYGYIGCGVNATYSPLTVNYLTDVYRYDPVIDSWTKLPPYPGGSLLVPVTFVIGQKAYILTGYDQSTLLSKVWEFYDPTR
jgi:N-acetylneuraminic acid mutarotase